jgi:hypothetical protein
MVSGLRVIAASAFLGLLALVPTTVAIGTALGFGSGKPNIGEFRNCPALTMNFST